MLLFSYWNGVSSGWKGTGLDFYVYKKYHWFMPGKCLQTGKRRMGRPPKPPADKYTEQVNVRMTASERELIEVQAQKQGVSLSAVLMRPWREEK